MTDELSFEEKVQGTLRFMRSKDERGLAEFIVFQSNAIDGLTKHNEELGAAYNKAIKDIKAQRKAAKGERNE